MSQTQTNISSSVTNLGFEEADKIIGKKYIRTGYILILIFFGTIVAWTAITPISSAAIATGIVSKDGHRKTVQHLEGGIIKTIFIKDGDQVKRNQKLIGLNDIQTMSDFTLLSKQKMIALTKEACLIAESKNKDDVTLPLPPDMPFDSLSNSVQVALKGNIDAFYLRREVQKNQINIIDQRKQQAEKKINALRKEHQAFKNQKEVISEEYNKYQEFEGKGLVSRASVFGLKREQSENEVDIASNLVAIESTYQEINNLKMEKSELVGDYSRRVSLELDSLRDQLVDLAEKLAKTEDKLNRTVIKAPIDGVIVNLKVNTIGGVIKPGEPLLDIIPTEGNLIIEAKVDTKDRDTIKIGQDAQVRFTAFNQRITEPVRGKVVLISADSIVSKISSRSKQSLHYKVKIELLEDPSTVMNGAQVYPGMQADVMIVTGKRTALEYFLKPILKSFNQAFRDD